MSPETLLTTLRDFTPQAWLAVNRGAEPKPKRDREALPTPALSQVLPAVSPVDLFLGGVGFHVPVPTPGKHTWHFLFLS